MAAGDFLLTTAPGAPTAPNDAYATEFTNKINDVDEQKSEYLTTESTNILSQKVFLERGGDES